MQIDREGSLKASTLVETIMAMVIIVIAFGTAMLLYMHITNGEQLLARSQAHILLKQLAEEAKAQQEFKAASFDHQGLQVKKQFQPYTDYPGALLMSLEALGPRGEILASYREIILADDGIKRAITKNEH